jgi:hypothetical protein
MRNQCSITEQRPLPDHSPSKCERAQRVGKGVVRARKRSLFGKRVTIKNFVRASFDFGGPMLYGNASVSWISSFDPGPTDDSSTS